MLRKRLQPSVDQSIFSALAMTSDGQALTYNRAPAADLAPWIARLYAIDVSVPDDYHLDCGVFNDAAMVHCQLSGNWEADSTQGVYGGVRSIVIFGPNTRRRQLSSRGGFTSFGYALRAGALNAGRHVRMVDVVDGYADLADAGIDSEWLMTALERNQGPENCLRILEHNIRRWIREDGVMPPDELTARFENQAFVNPARSIADFAEECGVSERTVERIVMRDFGMSPKQVLRRARAFDFASYLRGIVDAEEEAELLLRYYDQSHLIREFTQLFGMPPSQFRANPQPLLTMTLEMRQARRLEILQRLLPGAKRPWQ